MLRIRRQVVVTGLNLTKLESLRMEMKAAIKKQHDLYVNNLVDDVKAKPRDFYRYIKSKKKEEKRQGIPILGPVFAH